MLRACSSPLERQRIDQWIWYARIVKSRRLAQDLVKAKKVRVNRQKIDKTSYPVKIGDVLTIRLHQHVLVYRIQALATRRGPASEARTLYEVLS